MNVNRTAIIALSLLGAVAQPLPTEASALSKAYGKVRGSVVVVETIGREADPAIAGQLVAVGGIGSGVLISDDGKVVTASHVVQTADTILVSFLEDDPIPARVLASEPAADLALLQLESLPERAKPVTLGNSDRVEVGDQIFVVGAPFGISHTLTVGHISARREQDLVLGAMMPADVLQTDAAINQGNSGGPMFNLEGEVVGIVSFIISQSGAFDGLGFVITSNMARALLVEERSMWSGMDARMLQGKMAQILNLPQPGGILVQRVAQRSPASHLGLRGGSISAQIGEQDWILGGDIILEVMGVQLEGSKSRSEVRSRIQALKSGDEITATVLRGGDLVELKNFFFPDLLLPQPPGADEGE